MAVQKEDEQIGARSSDLPITSDILFAIADGKQIVTWIGGGTDLQKSYPGLKVQDDATVSFVEDGKFLSSNGNLASYISALELLEKMTNKQHRKFVESYL